MDITKSIIEDKKSGLSDKEIGDKYGVNLKFIEKIVTKDIGINISKLSINNKFIKKFYPKDFEIEKKSVWSFKSRGDWATHNGNYRGNWSPYIPRNIILRYSKEEELVLDYFCGAGTTAIECKLLNRNFIGTDINPYAIDLAKSNLDFGESYSNLFKPEIELVIGDARELNFIENHSIDLICAHPPYSDIINYTSNNPNDLSNFNPQNFLIEMEKVAMESKRVLKDNKYCAILIGDMRKNKRVIPLGFWTIERFLNTGFKLNELIIKRQHNCKTTGFWYTNSIKYNFLLLAHEYLAVFKKVNDLDSKFDCDLKVSEVRPLLEYDTVTLNRDMQLESTTVWIFNYKDWYDKTISNLIKRYSTNNFLLIEGQKKLPDKKFGLIITFPQKEFSNEIDFAINKLEQDGILAIVCQDFRMKNNLIFSQPLEIEKKLRERSELKIKEIVVISIENGITIAEVKNLEISHKYILIYQKT